MSKSVKDPLPKKKKKWVIKPSKKKLGITYILNFYDAYLRDRGLTKVAAAMETVPSAISDKIRRFPILQKVMMVADANRVKNNLKGYIVRHLSPNAKKLWEYIQKEADSIEALEQIFSGHPKKIRQELFIYAMMTNGYNISKAMQSVGITKSQLNAWRDDLDFLEMLEEIQFHKKNFFENQLLGLVAEAHPGAVMFVNRTVNSDRGYSEKVQVEHSGEIADSSNIKLEDLKLDIETRKKVLVAIREFKEAKAAATAKPAAVNPPKMLMKNIEDED